MGKLHELLAVEPDLKQVSKKTVSDAIKVFGMAQKFIGMAKTYHPLEEDGQHFPEEVQPMVTTVDHVLEQVRKDLGAWIKADVEKETTNSLAYDMIDIGGESFNLPATAWLNLEDKLDILIVAVADIPTNDRAIEWFWDEDNGSYRSRPSTTFRTEKVSEAIVGYQATPDHPAQLEWVNKDVRVGEWTKVLYSGMISVSQKRELLEKTRSLRARVKQARIRANQAEVQVVDVASAIFSEIFD